MTSRRHPPEGEWVMECSADLYASLKRDKEFTFLVTLARINNALKFGVAAHRAVADQISPAADRQRLQGFLYISAVMHELYEFRDATAENWSGLTVYHTVFGALDREELDAPAQEMLRRIRNRAAFHFQTNVAETTLPRMPNETYHIMTGFGSNRMDGNFDFPDLVMFHFLFGSLGEGELERTVTRYAEYSSRLRAAVARYIQTADNAVFSRLLDRGCVIRLREPGTYEAERLSIDNE